MTNKQDGFAGVAVAAIVFGIIAYLIYGYFAGSMCPDNTGWSHWYQMCVKQ